MQKLKLDLNTLSVNSFDVTPSGESPEALMFPTTITITTTITTVTAV